MILISHRGNTQGRLELFENQPNYIDKAISEGFDVEVDVWYKDTKLFLGHDVAQYEVDFGWFIDRITRLWIHCKNIEAVEFFSQIEYDYNYFWHQEDTLALTSHKYIWVFPGKQPVKNSISVTPELFNDSVDNCIGICSDFIKNYKS